MKRPAGHHAKRRDHLVHRLAQQRHEIAHAFVPWSKAASKIDRGIASLATSPVLPGATVALAAVALVWRPKVLFGWMRRAWLGMTLYKTIRAQKRVR